MRREGIEASGVVGEDVVDYRAQARETASAIQGAAIRRARAERTVA
ncbi:hypothetical protein AB0467_34500 [Streptomyces sp. NPDC052095]